MYDNTYLAGVNGIPATGAPVGGSAIATTGAPMGIPPAPAMGGTPSVPQRIDPKKVITGPNTLWSYVNAWDPKSINGYGTPKYSVSLIISKSDVETINAIRAAIQAAYEEGASKLKGNGQTVPPLDTIKIPLRDGDVERPNDPTYAGSYFVNANSPTAPGIVDANCVPITERSQVYSGCRGRASINFYAYNRNGNRGIACALNNLQKISDGPPLGGKPRAESDFARINHNGSY